MTVPTTTVDRQKSYPVRLHQLAELLEWDVVPRLYYRRFEVLRVAGPPSVTVADRLNHPRPHSLDQVKVGTVGWPRRESVEFPRLFGELRLLVLLPAVVSRLVLDEAADLRLVLVGRLIPDDVGVVVPVWLSDGLIVVGGRVVLHDVLQSKAGESRVEGVAVDLQGLHRVLHPRRGLQAVARGQIGAARPVPVAHLLEARREPFGGALRRGGVGPLKVVHVWDVPVVALRPRLDDPVDRRVAPVLVRVLEQRPDTEVLGVAKKDFGVGRRPSDPRRFTIPAYAAPKINALLDATFFAFVPCNLRIQKILTKQQKANKQNQKQIM